MAGIRKGVCKNYDECNMADSKEIQEIKSGEQFICEECKKPLFESSGKGTGGGSSKMKYMIGAVVAILLIGGGVFFVLQRGDKVTPVSIEQPTDNPQPQVADSIPETPPVKDSIKKEKPKPVDTPVASGIIDLGYATYEGPMRNGKPHGVGGKLTFKRQYTIDLKKMPAEYLEVASGDYMVNVKFDNGRLVQGELRRKDGTRRWISI